MNQREKLISDLIHGLFPGLITMLNISEYNCEIVFKDGDVVILDMAHDIFPWLESFRRFIFNLSEDSIK